MPDTHRDEGMPVRALLPLLAEGNVPIVVSGHEFVGLITRVDVLDRLRRESRRAAA